MSLATQNIFSNPIIIKEKNILRNSDFLSRLGRNARGEATPLVSKLIELYNSRNISQERTVEKPIIQLISKDPNIRNLGVKAAEQIISKYQNVEPITHRIKQKMIIRKEKRTKQLG